MKIAFVHYHLRPGGVTTVIRRQIAAIKQDCDIVVMTGEAPANDFPAKIIVIPEIGYDRPGKNRLAPETIAQKMAHALSDHWPSGCDILHVHNPLIAKNRHFLKVLGALQDQDIRLFLQVHDFAEDGRPTAYFKEDPYPPNCHYAAINARDYHALSQSGLETDSLHYLPNAIEPFDFSGAQKIAQKMILYPIRAIRRKNIGEALLLSLFFPDDRLLAVTLPPNSDQDRLAYQSWKDFSVRNQLRVLFDASRHYPFPDLVSSAEQMITTSISEGFGFSFLEPWIAGKNLFGRLIPDICADFIESGMCLDHLYDYLAVPLDWIDKRRFYDRWRTCLHENAKLFGVDMPNSTIDEAFYRMTCDHRIDFARLDEDFQQQVILKILSANQFRHRVRELNPFLGEIAKKENEDTIISLNKDIVLSRYGMVAYGRKLLSAYEQTVNLTFDHHLDKQKLARIFLNPDGFSLLKWGSLKDQEGQQNHA